MRNTNIIMLGSLNKGKMREYAELFKAYPHLEFKTLPEIVWNPTSLSDVEKGKDYYENAFLKGQIAHYAAKVPTISDDSGLEVDALDGKPGLYSARFATPTTDETQDQANVKKLLRELKGQSNRAAKFICKLLFFVEGVVLDVTGELEGTITEQPAGVEGFGYDPIFQPKGYEKTLAEIPIEEKNKISHRAVALRKLIDEIKAKDIKLVRP